MREGQVK
ncbi:hypothetical protein ACOMHN_045003 [Nucella lapillus]